MRMNASHLVAMAFAALFSTVSWGQYPYDVTIWLGLFAAAGTPEPVVASLRGEVNKLLAEKATRSRLHAAGGLEPHISTVADFEALIRRDYDKYGKLVREIGVKVD